MSNTENQAPAGQEPEKSPGKQPGRPIQLGLFNLVVTVGLLVFGAVSVANSLGEYLHPGDLINQMLVSLHAQSPAFPVVTYTSTATTAFIGGLLLTLQGANFGLIVWWALSRLRASKPAFWIPVVGAFISSTLTFVMLVILLVGDAAIMNAMAEFIKANAG